MMGSAFTGIPELQLDQDEAKQLSDAISRVNEHYGGIVLPEKYIVWGQFLMALGTVYGPRAVAFSTRLKQEAKSQPKTVDAQPIRVM